MDEERFITSTKTADDGALDVTLRPKTLNEYVGQDKIKSNLKVFIEASKKNSKISYASKANTEIYEENCKKIVPFIKK